MTDLFMTDMDEGSGTTDPKFPNQHIKPNSEFNPDVMITSSKQDYEIFVIGGGSGGVALARYAAVSCFKVGIADQVKPSTQNTTWGLGGTCVNVGCIPKKMMHTSSIYGELREDMRESGWDLGESDKVNRSNAFDWNKMVGNVQRHIKGLNLDIRKLLMDSGVMQFNALAELVDKNTIKLTYKDGKVVTKTAKNIVIAVGGRPNMNAFPGCSEYCISSDDLFSMAKKPGKTCIVGASYIALECGGFIAGMGYEVDVMVRSILLRGFDQEIAEKIGDFMKLNHVNFIRPTVPNKVDKLENGQLRVYYNDPNTNTEVYKDQDTVLVATGRYADLSKLNLDVVNAKLSKNNKLVTDISCKVEGTENIYALGDVVEGKLELTPTAILDGKLLAGRLLGIHNQHMTWDNIPTTVFTPLEYGCIGYSEEDAINKYGEKGIVLYGKDIRPLEWEFLGRPKDLKCYIKLICENTNEKKVIGLHQLGPNAGEVTQGYAVAMKMGATKYDFDRTVGIHPTTSEEFTKLDTEGKGGKGPC